MFCQQRTDHFFSISPFFISFLSYIYYYVVFSPAVPSDSLPFHPNSLPFVYHFKTRPSLPGHILTTCRPAPSHEILIPATTTPVTATFSSPVAVTPVRVPQAARVPQVSGSYMQEPRSPAHDTARTPPGTGAFAGVGIVAISGPGIMLSLSRNRVDCVYYFHISLSLFLVLASKCVYTLEGDAAADCLSFMSQFRCIYFPFRLTFSFSLLVYLKIYSSSPGCDSTLMEKDLIGR